MLSPKLSRALMLAALACIAQTVAFCAGEQETGAAWTLVKKIPVDKNLGIQQALFTDESFGVACSGAEAFVTTDGGAAWKSQSIRSRCFLGIDVADRSTFAVGTQCDGFYMTSDGGGKYNQARPIEDASILNVIAGTVVATDTWNLSVPQKLDIPIAYPALKAFCAVSSTQFFALSRNSTLIKSDDSGKTWTELPLRVSGIQPAFNEMTTCIRFSDAKNGVIVYYSSDEKQKGWFVLSTADGGANWARRDITGIIATIGRPLVSRDCSLVTIVPVFGQGDMVLLKRSNSK